MSRPSVAKVRFKEMPCAECGKPMRVGSNTRNLPQHLECGIKKAQVNMVQLKEHSGPYYERWRRGMQRFFSNEGGGGVAP